MSKLPTLILTSLLTLSTTLISLPSLADAKRDAMVKAADNEAGGAYVRTRFLQWVKVPFDAKDPRKKLLIVGDSHGQDLLNAIVESNALSNYQIRTRYIPNVCQMYLGGAEDISQFVEEKNKAICAQADTLQQAQAQIAEADVIIIASSWKDWSAERINTTIKNLKLRPEQTLKVLGRKSFGRINVRSYLRQTDEELLKLRNPVDKQQIAINSTLRQQLAPTVFVDIQQLICGNEANCPVVTPDLELISFDGGHFTPAGARFAGKILFSNPPLAELNK